MTYKTRPPANCRGARIAWDVLSERAADLKPPRTVVMLWYSPGLRPYPWAVELNDLGEGADYLDLDELELQDRVNNPHKYPGEPWNTRQPRPSDER